MNSSTKARTNHDGFPRVRKRNSLSNKASSRAAQNAVQRCTSLLKNNKTLAETLQQTRCELSTYKNFFEDSLEYMSKAKLAKATMEQLSKSLKIFIKAFDDSILLMDIDDSKWPDIKASKFNKNVQKAMNTVLEATDEVDEAGEAVSTDQKMCSDERNSLKDFDQIFRNASSPSMALQNSVDEGCNIVPKPPSKSPQKKTDHTAQNISTSQTKDIKGNDGTKTKNDDFSSKKYYESSPPHSSTSSQAGKKTKIPRCQDLAVNLKRQNIPKIAESQYSKPHKRKSPEKICEKSDFDSSKRKTFVIKSNNSVADSESTKNPSEDVPVSKKEKRKTYVKKVTDIRNKCDEIENPSEDVLVLKKEKRKTYVKKGTDTTNKCDEIKSPPDDVFVNEKDKRKTFVIKNNNNAVTDSENQVEEETLSASEDVLASKKDKSVKTISDIPNKCDKIKITPEDVFISEKDKRKTCVMKASDVSNESDKTASNVFTFEKDKEKTCCIKNSNILKEAEPLDKMEDKEITLENRVILSEPTGVDDVLLSQSNRKCGNKEDLYVSENDKRKTCVKNASHISNESEETACNLFVFEEDKQNSCIIKNSNILNEADGLNKMEDKEVVPENRVILSESSDVDDVFFSQRNRKTYGRKNSDKMALPQNNISECQYSLPTPVKSKSTSLITEENKNGDLEISPEFQCNTKTDFLSIKTKSITAETIESTVSVTKLNEDKEIFSNKITKDNSSSAIHSNADDKMEKASENLNSKTRSTVSDDTVTDVPMHSLYDLNKGFLVNDTSPKDEACKYRPLRTRRSFLETSESDNEVTIIDEIDFFEKRPAFETTPIRGQILKNKNKKFKFVTKKKKSILKKNSSFESNCDAASFNKNDASAAKRKSVQFISDDPVNKNNLAYPQSDTCSVMKKTKISSRKIKKNQEASIKNNSGKAANKLHAVKNKKRNCLKDAEVDDLIPKPKKTTKKNARKIKKDVYFDDDVISKYRGGGKVIPQTSDKTDKTEKDIETDFLCKKTGKNTFLVHAEIHAPPPFMEIEKMDEEVAMLNKLKNMKVSIVLNDIFKSKDSKILNAYDRDLCGKTAPMSFSGNASNTVIDPDESIEKLRCDPVPDNNDDDDDVCLLSDAILDTCSFDLQNDPGIDSEYKRTKRRRNVNYKEPPLNRKMRRC